MPPVGIEFDASSFDAFNKTLVEFEKISNNVDKRLGRLGKSLTVIFDSIKPSTSRSLGGIADGIEQIGNVIDKLDVPSVSALVKEIGNLSKQTNKFRKFLEAIGDFSKVRLQNFVTIGTALKSLISVLEDLSRRGTSLGEFSKVLNVTQKSFLGFKSTNVLAKYLGQFAEATKQFDESRAKGFRNFSLSLATFVRTLRTLKDSGTTLLELSKGLQTTGKSFLFFKNNRFSNNISKIFDSFSGINREQSGAIRIFALGIETLVESLIRLRSTGSTLGELAKDLTPFTRERRGIFRKSSVNQLSEFFKVLSKSFKELDPNIGRQIKAIGEDFPNLLRSLETIEIDPTRIKDIANNISNIRPLLKEFKKISKELKNIPDFSEKITLPTISGGNIDESVGSLSKIKNSIVDTTKKTEKQTEKIKRSIIDFKSIFNIFKVPAGFSTSITGAFANSFVNIGSVITSGIRTLGSSIRGGFNGIYNIYRNAVTSVGRISRDLVRQFSDGFEQTARSIEEQAQRAVQRGTRTLLSGGIIGLATSAVISKPIFAAVDFESQFADVLKTLPLDGLGEDAAQKFIVGLEAGLRNITSSVENPLSALENSLETVSGIAAQAGQLGVQRDDILQFTEVVGQLTVASDLSADAAGNFLARFDAVSESLNPSQYASLASTIVALGNNFATTETQITEFALRIAGVGNTLNLSSADIAGFSAAFAAVGLAPEAAGTAFTQLGDDILKFVNQGNASFSRFLTNTGRNVSQFEQLFREDAGGALEEFFRAFSELSGAEQLTTFEELGITGLRQQDLIRRMSSNVDGLSSALTIAAENFDDLGETSENFNALQREAATRAETTRSAINRLRNQFNDLLVSVGDQLLPQFREFLGILSGFTQRINEFISANPERAGELIRTFVSAAFIGVGVWTAFSGVLQTFIGLVVGPFARALITLSQFTKIIGFLVANPLALLGGFAALIPIVIAVSAAFIGINIILQDIFRNSEEVGDAFSRFTNTIFDLGRNIFNVLSAIGNLATELFRTGNTMQQSFSPVATILNSISDLLSSASQKAGQLSLAINGIKHILVGEGAFTTVTPDSLQREQELNRLQEERLGIIRQLDRVRTGQGVQQEQTFTFGAGEGQFGTASELANELGISLEDLAKQAGYPNYAALANDLLAGKTSISVGGIIGTGDENELLKDLDQIATKIDNLENQTTEFDNRFRQTIDYIINNSPIFRNLFGSDVDQAVVRAEVSGSRLKSVVSGFGDAARTALSAVRELISGDITSGLTTFGDSLRQAFRSFSRLGGVFDVSGFTTEDIAQTSGQPFLSSGTGQAFVGGAGGADNSISDGIIGKIREQFERVFSFDFSSDKDKITETIGGSINTGFSNVTDFITAPTEISLNAISAIEGQLSEITNSDYSEHSDTISANIGNIVKIGLLGASILIGSPLFTAAAGISGAVITLVENDFLGIKTGLEKSGISDVITNDVVPFINDLIGSLNIDLSSEGLTSFFDPITSSLDRLAKIDFSGIQTIASVAISTIASGIGLLIDNAIRWAGAGVNVMITGLETLADVVNLLLKGDIEAAFNSLTSGLTQIAGITLDTGVETIGSLFDTIENITGLELPNADEIRQTIDDIVAVLTNIYNNPVVQDIIGAFGNQFSDAINSIKDGISGFIDGLSGRDTSGLVALLTIIGGAIGVFVGAVTAGGLGLLKGVGDALPFIGNAIGSLVDALAKFASGDIGGGLEDLGGFIVNLAAAPLALAKGLFDSIIGFLNDIGITDFGSFDDLAESLRGIADQATQIAELTLGNAVEQIRNVANAIRFEAEDAIASIELRFLEFGVTINQRAAEFANTFRGVGADVEGARANLQRSEEALEEARLRAEARDVFQGEGTLQDFAVRLPIAIEAGVDTDTINEIIGDFQDQINNEIITGEPINLFRLLNVTDDAGEFDLNTVIADLRNRIAVEVGSQNVEGAQQLLSIANLLGLEEQDVISDLSKEFGEEIIAGLQEGIDGDAGEAERAQEVIDTWKEILGIGSPSTIFKEIGNNILIGLTDGMAETLELLGNVYDEMHEFQLMYEKYTNTSLTYIEKRWLEFAYRIRTVSNSFNISLSSLTIATNNIQNIFQPFVTDILRAADAIGILIDQLNQLNSVQLVLPNIPLAAQNNVQVQLANVPGRQFGGRVDAGRIYEVLEGSLPFEIFDDGIRNYLIPKRDGAIISPSIAGTVGGNTPIIPGSTNNLTNNVNFEYSVNVPVTFDTISSDVSNEQLERISGTITSAVEENLRESNQANNVEQRLQRAGRL